ncbi:MULTISPECIES: hypothetical protein [Prauserella]|uniref:Uncharacterized protein n=2 Tax=Prauserella TaxID=142577 RepID=A0A318LA39_9PSEU|nr:MULTISPECIES: hypothetical protein [Prauserella]PXY17730.1 hypothetical protein BA062_36865 [Prauserella flavalba]PXY18634.1 hypothetical protein BAY59_33715 [Prauserella coralliicola]TKG63567.1 hypothetical protein FCN18_30165 [Prauserella endophytica]
MAEIRRIGHSPARTSRPTNSHAARPDLERALEIAEDPKIADAKLAVHHLRLAASMFAGISDHIGHARTVMHLARASP